MTTHPIASLDGVTFAYRSWDVTIVAISNATVEFPSSGWVLVTGPNGAGKSTFLKLLCGALTPDAGEVRVDGRDPGRMSPTQRTRSISIVRQRPEQSLVSGLTVGEHANVAGFAWRTFIETLASLDPLGQFGFLSSAFQRPVETLSGGQQRTLGLALQLAGTAPLVLLDEPFTGLDSARRSAFESVLERLAADRCVVQITHEPEQARRRAQLELHIDQGAVEVERLAAGA